MSKIKTDFIYCERGERERESTHGSQRTAYGSQFSVLCHVLLALRSQKKSFFLRFTLSGIFITQTKTKTTTN